MQRSLCLSFDSHFLFPDGFCVPFALSPEKVTAFTVTWCYITVPALNFPAHNNKFKPE